MKARITPGSISQQRRLDAPDAVPLRVAEQQRSVLAPRRAAVGADLHPGRPRPVALQRGAGEYVAAGEPDRLRPHRSQHPRGQPDWLGPLLARRRGLHVGPAPRARAGADLEVEPDRVAVAAEQHGVPGGLVRFLVELHGRRPDAPARLPGRPYADVLPPLAGAAEPGGNQRPIRRFDDGRRVRPRERRFLPDEVERVLLRPGGRRQRGEDERENRARRHDGVRSFPRCRAPGAQPHNAAMLHS